MTNREAIEILRCIRVYEVYPKLASEETKQAIDIAIKAIERPAECNCSHCDYFKFSQSFIDNIVKFMTNYNIESVEDLMKELNHINELLGGRE